VTSSPESGFLLSAKQAIILPGEEEEDLEGSNLRGASGPTDPLLLPCLQWERLWFLLLTFTFGLTLTWLYFWWEVHNDYDEFNW
jgi:hypothetical protein